ncbi:hypothetical protein ASE12_04275 [Aeromicrobium sp. Root236]|uniref:AAA family ATPase n=1 Tax=Aeromicrobium sp. Root236 TaxID=1736498 RepID=UPI0006F4F1EE|nr:AAA family ATPase [Aeromicrobium sp. Root236]KRC64044.1 hypothetical protein ASE12_04275 [Aeromicrobium sp. Root236]
MREQKRAREAFDRGIRLLTADYSSGPVVAKPHFERALSIDPTMADAWLGLHACGGDAKVCARQMLINVSTFGSERARTGLTLRSRDSIGSYVTHSLETLDELCAVNAAYDISDGDYARAEMRIDQIGDLPRVQTFLRARVAHTQHQFELAIERFTECLGGDVYIDVEAHLTIGQSLARLGRWHPAAIELDTTIEQQTNPAAHAEAKYWRGLIHRAMGEEARAMELIREAYAERPKLSGISRAISDPTYGIEVVQTATAGVAEAVPTSSAAPSENEPLDVDAILANIDRRIGHEDIKHQVLSLAAQVRAKQARERAGLQAQRLTEHLVFTGPPGTGKTSVARDIAQLYRALGVLRRDDVIEVDRSKLVGQVLGATALKTAAVVESALGGVLFIDEAYSLQQSGLMGGDAFGSEALETLIKLIEDHRGDLVVIIAGYPREMQELLSSNPGLRSRFTTTIAFRAYTPDELVAISGMIAADNGDVVDRDAALSFLDIYIDVERRELTDTLGNGRLARNLVERAARYRDLRLFGNGDPGELSAEELSRLTRDDIDAAWRTYALPE